MINVNFTLLGIIISVFVPIFLWVLNYLIKKKRSYKEYNSRLFNNHIKCKYDSLFKLDKNYLNAHSNINEIPQSVYFKSTGNYNITEIESLVQNLNDLNKKGISFKGRKAKRALVNLYRSIQFLKNEMSCSDYAIRKIVNEIDLNEKIYEKYSNEFKKIKSAYTKLYKMTIL